MLTKYASLDSAQVLGVRGSDQRVRQANLNKFGEFDDYRTEDGYLYARIRAISSRVNKNHDGWPSIELAGNQDIFDRHVASTEGGFTVEAKEGAEYGFATFLGKPVFVDHHNSDPSRARGVIVDAKLHVEDHRTAAGLDPYYSAAPDNHLPPTWVELLLEVDAKSFPRLAKAILVGSKDPKSGIDGFSMGCDVDKSVCNICKNAAYSPDDYCEHVRLKGASFDVINPKTHKKESRKSYEDCYGVKFFEISAVFDPADETALLRDVVHKEGSVRQAELDPHPGPWGGSPECGHNDQGVDENGDIYCADCGARWGSEPQFQPPGPRQPGPEEMKYEMTRDLGKLPETEHPLGPQTGAVTEQQCPACQGKGWAEGKNLFGAKGKACPECKGTGQVQTPVINSEAPDSHFGQAHTGIAAPPLLPAALPFGADLNQLNPHDEITQGVLSDAKEMLQKGYPTTLVRNFIDNVLGSGHADELLPLAQQGQAQQIRGDGGNAPQAAPERDMSQFDVNNVTSKTAAGMPGNYDAWKTTPPGWNDKECPKCGSSTESGSDWEHCPVCDWGYERDPDREADRRADMGDHFGSRRTAENPVPQADLLHSPEDVETLREEQVCPVCGSTMDDETCDICGYVEPPEGFDNPDLSKHNEEMGTPEPQGFEPDPEPTPTPGGDTTLTTPDVIQGRNPGAIAGVRNDMADWNVALHPKVAGRINVTEQPITTSTEPATDEPKEQILQDETQPTTQRVRTASEFIAAAGRGKENNMAQRTAAEPVPAARPDSHGEVEGVGGYIDPSNEAASNADTTQVEVLGEGSTGNDSVSADEEGVNVEQGSETSKNIEAIPTKTWNGEKRQTSPVQGDAFPSENGQGAGRWSMSLPQHQAYDDAPFPKDDGGLAGGSAQQGNPPVDPYFKADDRVDVLKPVTSPSNNSGPTKTWNGTDGNGVNRQQDPVTNDSLEGEDLVNLSPGTVSSSQHIFSAIKLADLEVELGLLNPDRKYDRMAELEKASPEVVTASLEYANRVKTAGLKRQSKTAHRLPSFTGGTVPQPSEQKAEAGDESLFL